MSFIERHNFNFIRINYNNFRRIFRGDPAGPQVLPINPFPQNRFLKSHLNPYIYSEHHSDATIKEMFGFERETINQLRDRYAHGFMQGPTPTGAVR